LVVGSQEYDLKQTNSPSLDHRSAMLKVYEVQNGFHFATGSSTFSDAAIARIFLLSETLFNELNRARALAQRESSCAISRYSPSVNNEAFPPAAVVLIVNVRSVTKRDR
jgi:hypothetical protein